MSVNWRRNSFGFYFPLTHLSLASARSLVPAPLINIYFSGGFSSLFRRLVQLSLLFATRVRLFKSFSFYFLCFFRLCFFSLHVLFCFPSSCLLFWCLFSPSFFSQYSSSSSLLLLSHCLFFVFYLLSLVFSCFPSSGTIYTLFPVVYLPFLYLFYYFIASLVLVSYPLFFFLFPPTYIHRLFSLLFLLLFLYSYSFCFVLSFPFVFLLPAPSFLFPLVSPFPAPYCPLVSLYLFTPFSGPLSLCPLLSRPLSLGLSVPPLSLLSCPSLSPSPCLPALPRPLFVSQHLPHLRPPTCPRGAGGSGALPNTTSCRTN